MKLHHLKPAEGSKSKKIRVGRGEGGRRGKTAGRGTKGQKARSKVRPGFEGGQMPLQRRLPKRGFRSMGAGDCAEVRLSELAKVGEAVVDLAALKKARVVPNSAKRAKVIASGTLETAVTLKGIAASAGARAAIEQAGGKVET